MREPLQTNREAGGVGFCAAAGVGSYLKLSVAGASHAPEMTFRLENFPAGFRLDRAELAAFMERRAPGRDKYSTQRHETDEVLFRDGFEGDVTTGRAIVGAIANRDMRPADYGAARTIPRPSHADFGQWIESGRIPTGGGKNSGRLTAPVCAAGGLCRQWLKARGISVEATLKEAGGVTGERAMLAEIEKARKAGDSVGGRIHCRVMDFPAGVGGALFEGLESGLASALFAIPGVKALGFGSGFAAASAFGSDYNDTLKVSNFCLSNGAVVTATNRAGGILGGRATGMPIEFDVWMKPTPTIFRPQDSVDLATMMPATLTMKGRHDPCIARRAVPVVEAVTAFALADVILADEATHPRICLTLTGRTLAEDLDQYKSQRYFIDLVELRVDLLTAHERAKAGAFPELLWKASRPGPIVPIIFTFRRRGDGGAYVGGEKTRERFFRQLFSTSTSFLRRAAYVDFEEDFHALDGLAREKGARIVRSLHDFTGPVRNLSARLKALAAAGDIAKVAFQPRGLKDVSRLFTSPAARLSPRLILSMGPQGLASRVLAGRLGAPWTYASVGGLAGLGHVTPQELVRDYRFRSVSRHAALFGVTGWPLKATRSPELHNAMFAAAAVDALMIPFPAKTAREAIGFMNALGMKGLAVTIPHKEAVMPLLDRVDAAARRVGAVNTVVREGTKLVGYNTDVAGFTEAIRAFVGDADFKRLRVAVLGAGGASKAVVFALKKLGAMVEVFHRRPLSSAVDLIVNATPVDPIPGFAFTGRELVYDLVYMPAETPLLARARAAGCRCENGFSMLVAQAREQQRLFQKGLGHFTSQTGPCYTTY